MNLYLSRHGNTFDSSTPVIWAGSRNDLPLVEKGFQQARGLGAFLMSKKVPIRVVFTGPLSRTREYGKTMIETLKTHVDLKIDPRLNEIDYGDWTGKTQNEVIDLFGQEAVEGWDKKSIWPKSGNWGGSEEQIFSEVKSFAQDIIQLPESDVVIVTSNGRLRYFLGLVEGEFEKRKSEGSFKVKTGNICKLVYQNHKFHLEYWDKNPSNFV